MTFLWGMSMFAGMDFFDLAGAVFAGNIMTLSVLWALTQMSKTDDPAKLSWPVYGAFLLPVALFILILLPHAGAFGGQDAISAALEASE